MRSQDEMECGRQESDANDGEGVGIVQNKARWTVVVFRCVGQRVLIEVQTLAGNI